MKEFKKRYINLPIRKRLSYSFTYLCGVVGIIAIMALFNITSLKNLLNDFYNNTYKIEESALNASVALSNIQNNLYKANTAKKIEASRKFVEASEKEYEIMITNINNILEGVDTNLSDSKEMYTGLQTEITKGERYRNQITKEMESNDVEAVYEIFLNDYVPILNSISDNLNGIREKYKDNAKQQVEDANTQTRRHIVVFSILVLLSYSISIYLVKITTKSIVDPIHEIELVMDHISKGNLDVEINYHSKEELGSLCNSIRNMILILKSYITNITDVLKKLEEKDMTATIDIEYVGNFSPIKTSLENIVDSFHIMIGSIKETTSYLTIGAQNMAKTAKEIEKGAHEQEASINELVYKVNLVAEDVNETALNANKVNQVSNESLFMVERGNECMDSLVAAMKKLTLQSNEISKIINVIDGIADETNLLSLNASIESAREYDNGKGFAVIANEMRKLATQCSNSTKTTAVLINSSIDSMNKSSQITDETAKILQNIVQSSGKTSDFVDSICNACNKQAEELNEVFAFVQQITTVVEANTIAAKESHMVSQELKNWSEQLVKVMEDFIV